MQQLHIVSNRLPVKITIENGKVNSSPTVGGLATGMSSVYKKYKGWWFGWPGNDAKTEEEQILLKDALKKQNCLPVDIPEEIFENYYEGFSNKTVWPLYHYFTQHADYKKKYWDAYVQVNKIFADKIIQTAGINDIVWIHDYHLQIMPKMIREARPDLHIGFFLHIPFPSYEVFRILPWREELIEGLLGADLIGFHTYDYERHFMSAVRRILGHEINFNRINTGDRIVKVDAFPMGIDYKKFNKAAGEHQKLSIQDRSKIRQEIDKLYLTSPEQKLILSIDRLDYTKGIANRLEAFEYFLEKYPEYREKANLIMLAVPSRTEVDEYQRMKSEVDELVGRINGKYATMNWNPVWYFYRSFPFDSLIDLYTSCDIALLTPIRDGMNLVAKEYIASRVDKKGVLILSEMTGAAKEMSEALIINPNNYSQIADAIKEAIEMPVEEQYERNEMMQNRLKRYNVEKWANEFIDSLNKSIEINKNQFAKEIIPEIENAIRTKYKKARNRIVFLDYDGTLVGFQKRPELAKPDAELFSILDSFANAENTELVLISGRDKDTFNTWFGDKNYSLITDHGVWHRNRGEDWEMIEQLNADWKEIIRPSLEFYVDRTPGSFIEEKNFSLVWHYRKSDPELGNIRAIELKDEMTSLIANYNLDILEGNKVIEIKNGGINKGRAALHKIGAEKYDFILGMGDDWTDEYLFEELPENADTIKIGLVNTNAKYNLKSPKEVRGFLKFLIE